MTAGYQALDSRDFDQAISRADQQLQQTPTGAGSAEALYLKGRGLEQKTVNTPAESRQALGEARDDYQQALQQQPSPALERLIHAGIANTSYFLDDYPTALQEWMEVYPKFDDSIAKGFMLYRIGLCQQRLGQFAQADQTFADAQQQFPGTDAAQRAHAHQGYKSFMLQLATFASSANADATIAKLRKQGMNPSIGRNAQGNTVISIGPIADYRQALDLKNRMSADYPTALILP